MPESFDVAVIGGGPAGLMAAERAAAAGARVGVFDANGSLGRKILLAGKGGLNLTHGEKLPAFLQRYGAAAQWLTPVIRSFTPTDLREFAAGLGIATFVGTSGRVFPEDLKAAHLLRRWLARLRRHGVVLRTRHRWRGSLQPTNLVFDGPEGQTVQVRAQALVLALGGGSWPRLGSDGAWVPGLRDAGLRVATLEPANCGFEAAWSENFRARYAGTPVKAVSARGGSEAPRVGEFVVTQYGVEGSLVYGLSAALRHEINVAGRAVLTLDLLPDHPLERVVQRLARPRGKRSWSEHLRRTLNLPAVKIGLLREAVSGAPGLCAAALGEALKSLPVPLSAPRPLAEAISTAGGLALCALDSSLMLHRFPGVFCAGEMLDWEAPTGGYLLTACFATGASAGSAAAAWARGNDGDDRAP